MLAVVDCKLELYEFVEDLRKMCLRVSDRNFQKWRREHHEEEDSLVVRHYIQNCYMGYVACKSEVRVHVIGMRNWMVVESKQWMLDAKLQMPAVDIVGTMEPCTG